jgi:putative SOS response-associated peptidase YedK
MCGRFQLVEDAALVVRYFNAQQTIDFEARYNIAPRQDVPVVTAGNEGRIIEAMGWGLVPYWTTDINRAIRPTNAKSETVATSGMFRTSFAKRRCLIPASGFYEWQTISSKHKQPYLIDLKDRHLFAMAGLYDNWKDPTGNWLRTFTIITTEPNHLVSHVHDRMPVILAQNDEALWLDPTTPLAELQPILIAYPASEMRATPISTLVNSVSNEGPEIMQGI